MLIFLCFDKKRRKFFRTKWASLQSDFNDLNIPEWIFANLLESHKNRLHFFCLFAIANWFIPNLKGSACQPMLSVPHLPVGFQPVSGIAFKELINDVSCLSSSTAAAERAKSHS